LGLLLFFDCDDFAALVVTAVGADGVRQALLAAVAARNQVARRQGVVRPAAVPAALTEFPFRLRGHELTPIFYLYRRLKSGEFRSECRLPTGKTLQGRRLKDYTEVRLDCQGKRLEIRGPILKSNPVIFG